MGAGTQNPFPSAVVSRVRLHIRDELCLVQPPVELRLPKIQELLVAGVWEGRARSAVPLRLPHGAGAGCAGDVFGGKWVSSLIAQHRHFLQQRLEPGWHSSQLDVCYLPALPRCPRWEAEQCWHCSPCLVSALRACALPTPVTTGQQLAMAALSSCALGPWGVPLKLRQQDQKCQRDLRGAVELGRCHSFVFSHIRCSPCCSPPLPAEGGQVKPHGLPLG